MDYVKEITAKLKKLNTNELKCVYQFIRDLMDGGRPHATHGNTGPSAKSESFSERVDKWFR